MRQAQIRPLSIIALLAMSMTLMHAQLKFVVEDFEGFAAGSQDLKMNGVFVFGNTNASVEMHAPVSGGYSGSRYIKINEQGVQAFGGWGKGLGLHIQLKPNEDFLNFYINLPSGINRQIRIEIQEDDNHSKAYEKSSDDSWICVMEVPGKGSWQLVSVPLASFRDDNDGGNGVFDISYSHGRLFSIVFSFTQDEKTKKTDFLFDFLCFSRGKLPTGNAIFGAPQAKADDFCSLGAWSKEGNTANFSDIATGFEKIFLPASDKKLAVAHFFQPFAFDGGAMQNLYPSVERINKVIEQGYIPMITLEDHFVNAKPGTKQPNLYSITEGHLDHFFAGWAKQIGQVKGTVLLRILHEFNGDWYPWCIINNDKNPELLKKAFRRIHDIFIKEQGVTNVKFIWCPNSMSVPQEKWNYIMDAYPGDEYVHYVGLDIYNGAGKGNQVWRSFRKEGMENYFILTTELAHKPLFICETASRERKGSESVTGQSKAEWIMQMADALSTDMSKVRMLAWFNEKESFHVNSSKTAKNAYLEFILKNPYFTNGMQKLHQFVNR